MPKSTLPAEVARLLDLIRNGGAWPDALSEIGKKYQYKASDELLPLSFRDEENSNAYFAICHYVESEPAAAFIARVIRLAPKMSEICPDKLAFFVRRMIRSDSYSPKFRRAAREASAAKRKILFGIVQDYLRDLETYPNPAFEKRCNQLTADLSK